MWSGSARPKEILPSLLLTLYKTAGTSPIKIETSIRQNKALGELLCRPTTVGGAGASAVVDSNDVIAFC